jgi:hypothetical protein
MSTACTQSGELVASNLRNVVARVRKTKCMIAQYTTENMGLFMASRQFCPFAVIAGSRRTRRRRLE